MTLPAFYPVLPDSRWIARLVPLGVKLVQLRLKEADMAEVRRQIAESLEICARHDCQLIVNDYWQEAIALGADYVHLGQEDLAAADLEAIRGAGIRLGLSTHSHEELKTALRAAPDYVALGPVYETILKKMKWAPQGLDRVREWKSLIPCPLVAIGGITLERAPGVLAAGADTIAVVTDLVTHEAPERRTEQWLAEIGP
ncbi:MAG: thiamine phosphate synthase [Alphaproteobacteria bacterium]|nr:MAG: thiamine phosphate synthase [Alphaproteobacteria bacterium]